MPLRSFAKKHIVPRVFPAIFFLDRVIATLSRRYFAELPRKEIVFVRVDNLGDFILWLPAARALREQWPWPGCQFVLIAHASWSAFAQSLTLFDRVISLNRRRFQRDPLYRFWWVFRLARLKPELLVTAIHSRDPTTADTIARAVNAARKIAPVGDSTAADIRISVSNPWYDELIPTPDTSAHESIRNRIFIERLAGIRVDVPWPVLAVPSQSRVPKVLGDAGHVVIAPGAVSPLRAWPAKLFAEIAGNISARTPFRVVLTGLASERQTGTSVARTCSVPPINLIGKLSVNDLIAVLKTAKLVITNETGTAHLAAALRVPTVCLVGGGHFGRFVPYPAEACQAGITLVALQHAMPCYHCNWQCIHPIGQFDPAPCVSGITIPVVWDVVERLLGKGPDKENMEARRPA